MRSTPTTRSWSRRSPCAASPMRGLAGTNAYLYLESIEISQESARRAHRDGSEARERRDQARTQAGWKHGRRPVRSNPDGLDQYAASSFRRSTPIRTPSSSPTAIVLTPGEATGDVNEATIRRIQIREDHQGAPRQGSSSCSRRASRCCRCSSSTRWRSTATTTS